MASQSTPSSAADNRQASSIIEVRNFDFAYGDSQALFDISMDIREKEVTAFIGPSGCGKSTFLRCFNRMNDLIDIAHIQGGCRISGVDIYGKDVDVSNCANMSAWSFRSPIHSEIHLREHCLRPAHSGHQQKERTG